MSKLLFLIEGHLLRLMFLNGLCVKVGDTRGLPEYYRHSLVAMTSGGSTGGNFPNFMQFFGKIWQICMLTPPPEGLAPPPTSNPGSAPDDCFPITVNRHVYRFNAQIVIAVVILEDSRGITER